VIQVCIASSRRILDNLWLLDSQAMDILRSIVTFVLGSWACLVSRPSPRVDNEIEGVHHALTIFLWSGHLPDYATDLATTLQKKKCAKSMMGSSNAYCGNYRDYMQ
jgi:hypothetical protein